MTDERRFDDLLREDAAALPPPAAGEINPWKKHEKTGDVFRSSYARYSKWRDDY